MESLLIILLGVRTIVAVGMTLFLANEWDEQKLIFTLVLPAILGVVLSVLLLFKMFPVEVIYTSMILGDVLCSFSSEKNYKYNIWPAFVMLVFLVIHLGNI